MELLPWKNIMKLNILTFFECMLMKLYDYVLGWKIQKRMKGLIFYKTKNGNFAMKNHYEIKHCNVFWMYVNEIVQLCFAKTYIYFFKKFQSSKVVILGSTSAFFNNTTTYQNKMKNKRLLLMISCGLLWRGYSFET